MSQNAGESMILHVIRGSFLLLCAAVASLYVLPFQRDQELTFTGVVIMLIGALAIAGTVIAIDMFTRRKRLSAVSGVFLGLIAGLIAAYALSFVVDLFGLLTRPSVEAAQPQISPDSPQFQQLDEQRQSMLRHQALRYQRQLQEQEAYFRLLRGVKVFIGLITCYLSISLVIQTKDDFRFVIPYVEFAKQIRGTRPTVVDTSVIVDGRIIDILDTGVMQGTLIVPKFVLNELQTIADSTDKLRRARGRRGLDVLHKLQDQSQVEVVIEDREPEGAGVDQKLVNLAMEMQGRILTNDYNLNKIARLRGLEVINLNDLAKALRPVVLPGERISVTLVKPGESAGQGVGYLEDGTMVVVEGGAEHLKETVSLTVTSTLQTSAGRMIFGKYEGPAGTNQSGQPEDDSGNDKGDSGTGGDKPTA
jgi:uncharacterized protein YacL/energy-converting hydrogenase Eha subunit A